MNKVQKWAAATTAALAVTTIGFAPAVSAATTVVVTPSNEQGWTRAATTAGGSVDFVSDSTAPAGAGALRLATDVTTTAKAQYMHAANTPIAEVTDLSYHSKQVSASFAGGAPSYQLPVMLNGTAGFTTFVFEPYQNGTVVPGAWQQWDVDADQFWSSRTVTCSNGGVVAGGGGAPFYTLEQIRTMCPEAIVVGFGVNIGSNNPSYEVLADLVTFNDVTYNFEPALKPSNKDACKDGGWMAFNSPTFKNQGDCVSSVASKGRSDN